MILKWYVESWKLGLGIRLSFKYTVSLIPNLYNNYTPKLYCLHVTLSVKMKHTQKRYPAPTIVLLMLYHSNIGYKQWNNLKYV